MSSTCTPDSYAVSNPGNSKLVFIMKPLRFPAIRNVRTVAGLVSNESAVMFMQTRPESRPLPAEIFFLSGGTVDIPTTNDLAIGEIQPNDIVSLLMVEEAKGLITSRCAERKCYRKIFLSVVNKIPRSHFPSTAARGLGEARVW